MARETQDQILQRLLANTEWNESLMAEVARLSTTRHIKFRSGSSFEPGALRPLANLPRLQFLSFDGSALSLGDMADLARLPVVSRLDLRHCALSDAHIEHLVTAGIWPRLKDLWLEGSAITDAALPFIARLTGLQWLILGGTRISDTGLTHLQPLSHLRTLWLHDTEVSDAGLLHLAALPRLTALGISGTKATLAGLDALFAAQVTRGKTSTRAIDPQERAAAESTLWDFLRAMHDWEHAAVERGGDITRRYQATHTSSQIYSPEEAQEWEGFWANLRRDKAAILACFCTSKKRVYSEAASYGTPHEYQPDRTVLVDAEQPAPSRIVLYVSVKEERGGRSDRFRFVMVKKGERWLVDSRQWWDHGWSPRAL